MIHIFVNILLPSEKSNTYEHKDACLKTRLKRIESKIAQEVASNTQNTFKTQNTSYTQNLIQLYQFITDMT
jgi:hypothetical protein